MGTLANSADLDKMLHLFMGPLCLIRKKLSSLTEMHHYLEKISL